MIGGAEGSEQSCSRPMGRASRVKVRMRMAWACRWDVHSRRDLRGPDGERESLELGSSGAQCISHPRAAMLDGKGLTSYVAGVFKLDETGLKNPESSPQVSPERACIEDDAQSTVATFALVETCTL